MLARAVGDVEGYGTVLNNKYACMYCMYCTNVPCNVNLVIIDSEGRVRPVNILKVEHGKVCKTSVIVNYLQM